MAHAGREDPSAKRVFAVKVFPLGETSPRKGREGMNQLDCEKLFYFSVTGVERLLPSATHNCFLCGQARGREEGASAECAPKEGSMLRSKALASLLFRHSSGATLHLPAQSLDERSC